MSKLFAALSVAAVASAALPAIAPAADLDQIMLAPELPMTRPVEVGSGWYLRGDIGYSVDTGGDTPGAFDSGSIDSDWSGSAGIGYHFNDWLRSDVTFEYSKGDFNGRSSTLCSTGACDVDQDFKAWGFMANGYVDLGTFAGFTPYVGAGAGVMRVDWKSFTPDCVGAVACGATSHDGEESWRFAYQLSAGVAYNITQNLKLDLGYRYFDVADGDMFHFSSGSGASGIQGSDDGFSKHEIRAGLRYEIW